MGGKGSSKNGLKAGKMDILVFIKIKSQYVKKSVNKKEMQTTQFRKAILFLLIHEFIHFKNIDNGVKW